MSENLLIQAKNIDFQYNIFSTTKTNFQFFGKKNQKKYHKVFSDFNFKLQNKEFVGIAGKNGSGKTTLLRILSGIYNPSKGTIFRKHNVTNPLINLSAGMAENCNAIENIILKYLYAGLTKKQALKNIKKILDFAQLGEFENLPVRTYSTGMRFKLNFAIMINIPSKIIVMDEWISVSDQNFRDRVYSTFKKYIESAQGIIMASNNHKILEEKCTRIVHLNPKLR